MNINLVTTSLSLHHEQIEWNQLLDIISQFAHFDINKIKLKNSIFTDINEIQSELNLVEVYSSSLSEDDKNILSQLIRSFPEEVYIDSLINRLSKGGILDFSELNLLAKVLETGLFIKQSFKHLKISSLEYYKNLDPQIFPKKFLREFRHLVDTDGVIHLDRHPELKEISKYLRDLEERIRKQIHEWLNHAENQKVLQFNSYDIHYDRYVVPIRSDSYRAEFGTIVSKSDSGQTLFVELNSVRDMCNRRMELNAKIDEIINQLSVKFSQLLIELRDHLETINHHLLTFDFYLSKVNFSQKYQLTKPILKKSPGFKLINLFHPLLSDPIKNDVTCESGHHGIVVSGPNTGGKTVFLKSISLSFLLFYHGHFVPAQEAEMYPYDGLFYFGNDLQDISYGLSSFSGEVKNYIQLIENILPTNLILIDEIFNSTSSDEASALSLAYFDELHKRGQCHLVVSTHHQMFKTLIHQDKNYLSCHVGFDTKNLKPTYKVQWGTPGASMAIDIFKILSRDTPMVQDVPANALKHLNTKNISYETLLQKVSQKQIELDQLLSSNKQLEEQLKNQKGAMEGILNLKIQDEVSKAHKEIEKIIGRAHELITQVKSHQINRIKKVDEVSFELKSQLKKLSPKKDIAIDQTPRENIDLLSLKVGDMVYSYILKKDVFVHSIDLKKKEVTVAKGPIKIKVPSSTLKLSQHQKKNNIKVLIEKNHVPKLEIDVRGMRLSEFQAQLDFALSDLLTGDIPSLNIIHGHGDGILKKWLRNFIKTSKDYTELPSETGNDGETRIVLK